MSPKPQTQTLLDRVPSEPSTLGPPWIAHLRREAASGLRESGFPHRKVEAWRFTPLKPIVDVPFDRAPAGDRGLGEELARAGARLGDDGAHRVVLANGRPLPRGAPPEGISVRSLADALAEEPAALEPHLGKLFTPEYFSALNTALFEDGVIVRVRAGARPDRPIHLVHVAVPGERPSAAYPRVLVVADPGCEVAVIESYLSEGEGKHLVCPVTEVDVGAGASVDHLRVVQGAASGYHVAALAARQQKDSRYASRVVTLGGALSRLDLFVRLEGEGAECLLDGAYHAGGREAVDHHTWVDHVRPHASSQESYRGILDDSGQAVFDGTIFVRPDAQQSSAHQENRNLLLSDDASVNTKPHLEIEADDVSCSHGATVGALSEDELFYLRARGLPLEQAEAVLTYAFVREIVDRIPHAPARRRLAAELLDRLPHGESILDHEVSEEVSS